MSNRQLQVIVTMKLVLEARQYVLSSVLRRPYI
jgi:hypothetical protein